MSKLVANSAVAGAERSGSPQNDFDTEELVRLLRGSRADLRASGLEADEPVPDRVEGRSAEVVPDAVDGSAGARDVTGAHSTVARDWSHALDLVEAACEAIRIGEERVEELERAGEASVQKAREDLRVLHLQFQAQDRRVREAEARAVRAEARAEEAEAWLARLHDAVVAAFGSQEADRPARRGGAHV